MKGKKPVRDLVTVIGRLFLKDPKEIYFQNPCRYCAGCGHGP